MPMTILHLANNFIFQHGYILCKSVCIFWMQTVRTIRKLLLLMLLLLRYTITLYCMSASHVTSWLH